MGALGHAERPVCKSKSSRAARKGFARGVVCPSRLRRMHWRDSCRERYWKTRKKTGGLPSTRVRAAWPSGSNIDQRSIAYYGLSPKLLKSAAGGRHRRFSQLSLFLPIHRRRDERRIRRNTMARLAALICLLVARQTAAEGGRGHAVASSTWQSTRASGAISAAYHHNSSEGDDVLPAPRRGRRGRAAKTARAVEGGSEGCGGGGGARAEVRGGLTRTYCCTQAWDGGAHRLVP